MITREDTDERDCTIPYLRDGAPEEFKVFFFEYYPIFFSFSLLLSQDRPTARKLTMEAFFLLWERRVDFGSAKKRKAFLYLAIRNRCMQ
jgi:DNA-directed RNA polymerase specialized sigma24 family protein